MYAYSNGPVLGLVAYAAVIVGLDLISFVPLPPRNQYTVNMLTSHTKTQILSSVKVGVTSDCLVNIHAFTNKPG